MVKKEWEFRRENPIENISENMKNNKAIKNVRKRREVKREK